MEPSSLPTPRRSHLVKVEHQIELADIVEVFVENLYKVVDGLKEAALAGGAA